MPSLKRDSVPRDTVASKPTNASPALCDMALLVKIPRVTKVLTQIVKVGISVNKFLGTSN
jgi:hypothetical protein